MGGAVLVKTNGSTVDPGEVARFSESAASWWDPEGAFAPLHKLNPVRLGFIRDRLAAHFGRDIRSREPFAGLRALDIGCGGGLVSEPLARLGFAVTGIDAGVEAIAAAKSHAEAAGVAIEYRPGTVEDFATTGETFDAVLALEVIEHVADPTLFLGAAARLVQPGGALIAASINRTAKGFLLAIVGAEYVLGWLPRGTHRWSRFMRPSEVAARLRPHGVAIRELAGLVYSPLRDAWSLSADLDVNYLLFATRRRAQS